MTARVLCMKEVCYLTGLARATIYRRLREPDRYGHFPQPLRLGKNRIGWLSTTIDEFIRNLDPA